MIWAVQPDRSAIARNLRSAMGAYAFSTAQGAALDLGAAGVFSSGVDYAVFNALVLSEPVSPETLGQMIDECVCFYRSHRVGWSCWLDEAMVDPSGRAEAARLLEARGLRWIAEHDGMIAHQIAPDRRRLPAVDARRVADAATREDFVRVCSRVFLLPEGVTRHIYGSARFWEGVLYGWVGYEDGQAVAIAVSAADQGSVGLYSVGTLPAFRRRGLGESLTRHAIGEAADRSGLRSWILQSTPAGLRLYRRMGYQSRSRIGVWTA